MSADFRDFGRHAKRILVVDDDGSMRALASQALRSAGYHVTTAKDGHGTLAALREYSVDLIVCDVAAISLRRVDQRCRRDPGKATIGR